jgi:hypothetical protein
MPPNKALQLTPHRVLQPNRCSILAAGLRASAMLIGAVRRS